MEKRTRNREPGLPLREILVTGSVGRSSIATMVAALLHGSGEAVVHLGSHYLHSPLERLTFNGTPVSADQAARLLTDRGAAEPRVDDLLGGFVRIQGARWLVRSGLATDGDRVELVVFAPILPAAGHAGEVARDLCRAIPMASAAVSAPQRESALDVLRPAYPGLQEVAQLCRLSKGRADLEGQALRLRTPRAEYRLTLPLLGYFQLENAATAILAVEQLAALGVELTPEGAASSLTSLRLPGRLEVLKREPLVLVDSCSVGAALPRIRDALRDLAGSRRILAVLDLSEGLDFTAAIDVLAALHVEIFAVLPPDAPAAQATFRQTCYEAGLPLQISRDVAGAIDQALPAAGSSYAVIVLGSPAAAASARALVLGLMPPDTGLHYTG